MDPHTERLLVSYREERELAFEAIDGQGQLSVQRNEAKLGADGSPDIGLRVKITQHSNILGTRVFGVVNKLRWGEYKGKSSCLLVVRFRFAARTSLFRLRKAAITLRFENHPRDQGATSKNHHPVIRVFSPGQIYGIPTEVDHEHTWACAARCSVSAGPVNMGPEGQLSRTTRYSTQCALEIAGIDEPDEDKELSNKVIFEIDENPKVAKGIPRELYFGAVVECQGAMQADVETTIGDRTAWPWTSDDPIIMKPNVTYGHVPASIPMDFERLTDDDWKVLVPYREERTNAVQGRPDE